MISDVSNGRKWQGITRRDNIRPMSNHPLNLALRFVLELAALAAMGYWNEYEPTSIIACGLSIGGLIIILETRHPSYHGILWQRLNPDLESWFYREKNTQNAKIPPGKLEP